MNDTTRIIDEAIAGRRSVRGFLPDPVSEETVRDILNVASRAPSGTNMQPWNVYVAMGDKLETLSKAVGAAFDDPNVGEDHTYKYYPDKFPEPYLTRRRKVGWDLYSLVGIAKGDHEKMHTQHAKNFAFFGAPVGMIFTLDERLEIGSWLDYGMFLQNIMITARGRGLDTCPQAAFAPYHKIIRPELEIPDHEVILCGMSLGKIDKSATENTLETERASVDEFARFWCE
ncbi:MAG: nitroreductase [Pseudomonadota bacterium]